MYDVIKQGRILLREKRYGGTAIPKKTLPVAFLEKKNPGQSGMKGIVRERGVRHSHSKEGTPCRFSGKKCSYLRIYERGFNGEMCIRVKVVVF